MLPITFNCFFIMKKLKNDVQRAKIKAGQVANEAMTVGAINSHTEICVDLKILDTGCAYMPLKDERKGSLVHDAPGHFSFTTEKAMRKLAGVKSKNECLLSGQCINVKQNRDGVVFPTFRFGKLNKGNLSFKEFCILAARELLQVSDLIKSHE